MFLFGFYKAVGVLLIFKVKVNLLPRFTWFLSGIRIQKIQCIKYVSTRFLFGFYKAVGVLLIFKIKVNLQPGLTWFLSGLGSRKYNA